MDPAPAPAGPAGPAWAGAGSLDLRGSFPQGVSPSGVQPPTRRGAGGAVAANLLPAVVRSPLCVPLKFCPLCRKAHQRVNHVGFSPQRCAGRE